ncbi:MAG: hypothetical protein JWO53_757, partial [Chlamydiia bacterium]|nr:hypothetical protein [Chlamydiia bacterium]
SKEDLASLPLDNDLYQTVLYKMLKGNIPQDLTDPPANGEYYKSLCDFIQISNTKSPYIMSIYLAPRELLLALFQNEKTVKKVLAKRNEIHEALKEKEREEKKTGIKSDNTPFRTEKSQILRDTVIKMLPLNFDINFIDFGVSSSNPEDYE